MLVCGREDMTACSTGHQFLIHFQIRRRNKIKHTRNKVWKSINDFSTRIYAVSSASKLYLQDHASRSNPFQAALSKLGDGLVKLGEDVTSAGGHLGNMFVGLGNKMRGTMYVLFCFHISHAVLARSAAYCTAAL